MTLTASRTNRSRYVRDKASPSEIALKQRDHAIIQLVYNHRFLTLELLWHLLQPGNRSRSIRYAVRTDGKQRPKRYGFGQQALSKRLRQLFHAGYLERHYPTDQPMGRGHGAPRAIYGLGLKSVAVLEERVGVPAYEIRRIVERNRVTSPFLRHAIEVARFRVTLELACQRSADEVRLLFWEQGQQLHDNVYANDANGDNVRLPIFPDAMFALEVVGMRRACFMLEVDRGTMPIRARSGRSDIVKKLIAYMKYREPRIIMNRYAYRFHHDDGVAELLINDGSVSDWRDIPLRDIIKGFRVLFVVPTGIEASQQPSARIANILREISGMGPNFVNTELFWFTVPKAYEVEKPDSILKPIWITAKSSLGLQSLIS